MAVGWPRRSRTRSESLTKRLVIVSGNFFRLPTKGAPLAGKIAETQHIIDSSQPLPAVVVNDDDEIVERMMGGEHGRLPDRSLFTFAVTDEHKTVK